ncbi:MAG: Crp/Fnr family transcriptional regulator [Eubacteriales bacterium]|nr:Crp/Fnr family transcriptional regulator [Eubacteriales bacterium]
MKKYIEILKNNPLFRGLSEDKLLSILDQAGAVISRKRAGEYIFHAGDTTASMGFVLSGSILVIQEDLWGHRNIMAKLAPGNVFAELFAAVPGSVLNVSVAADTDCELLFLNMNRLLNSGFPPANLISVLAGKTMAFNDKISHISKRSTRDKLLSFLSAQAVQTGSPSFDIAYNRQQLADYLCVDRAAMSVELSRLQKDGFLRYHKNHFELRESGERACMTTTKKTAE